jgi:ATP-binding cassette subfamily F protein uup
MKLEEEKRQRELKQQLKKEQPAGSSGKKPVKKKLSYKEQKEYEQLERDIEVLEQQKTTLENEINSGITDFEQLQKLSEQIKTLMETIDEKTLRWMELEELKEKLS